MTDTAPDTVHVFMALDPETLRVLMQTAEFADGSFPRGLRGIDWPIREGDVPASEWARLLSGGMTPDEQHDFHRDTWTQNGETAWPTL